MKLLATKTFRPVHVLKNTPNGHPATYMVIKCAVTGEQLHLGLPKHIRKIAKEKYNVVVD